ncbi:MAG TPA: L-seryl-tRNA(Sec) selenium transferase [Vicinamibacterales bacterium]|jgi:L-seryl-tRNA(Ser) seleniumtransferase|nr:L-seryl-tRNA(Sec) selenium transferase [Vicinamibacterales bacterium]
MRSIPSVEQLRQRPEMQALEEEFGRALIVEAIRAEAAAVRGLAASGSPIPDDPADAIVRAVPSRLAAAAGASLRPVINATGVIVHTNLGRAPLSSLAVARVAAIAGGYSNLEYDLAGGRRGKRDIHAAGLVSALTGAEAAVIVNNNAAATLVVLAALAAGREAVVSRGELVEIGGGFRIPDVMAASGAILREVGTTNRTRAADYAAAISERTALILRVHPSNFRMEGFVERPTLEELAAIGRKLNVPVVEDQGSGYLGDRSAGVLKDEPGVRSSIAGGADLVLFSGDKLLGGPQAGIIAGRERLVALVRTHPLMRALRADKMTYAALEATLQEHAAGRAADAVPVSRMIDATAAEIASRASRIAAVPLSRLAISIVEGASTIGGGSAPGSALPTRLLALSRPGVPAAQLEARLRAGTPPIIARIEEERVLLDLRTVLPEQDEAVAAAISALDA